jgi:hypothetical protein
VVNTVVEVVNEKESASILNREVSVECKAKTPPASGPEFERCEEHDTGPFRHFEADVGRKEDRMYKELGKLHLALEKAEQ